MHKRHLTSNFQKIILIVDWGLWTLESCVFLWGLPKLIFYNYLLILFCLILWVENDYLTLMQYWCDWNVIINLSLMMWERKNDILCGKRKFLLNKMLLLLKKKMSILSGAFSFIYYFGETCSLSWQKLGVNSAKAVRLAVSHSLKENQVESDFSWQLVSHHVGTFDLIHPNRNWLSSIPLLRSRNIEESRSEQAKVTAKFLIVGKICRRALDSVSASKSEKKEC